jgi:hypothetical protein
VRNVVMDRWPRCTSEESKYHQIRNRPLNSRATKEGLLACRLSSGLRGCLLGMRVARYLFDSPT